MEQGLYQHPSPFSTNIYWMEEMALGPGPPQKKGTRDRDKGKAESSRALVSGGAASRSTMGTSSDTVVVDEIGERGEQERRSGDGWNKRRYQREDEILWGIGGGHGLARSRSSTTGSGGNYYVARNPAVNDLHPPVVSTQPTHRSETKWMLQPPPSAKIMEGKVKAKRSRSGSGVSSQSDSSRRRDDMNLGRIVGERLLDVKAKLGRLPSLTSDSAAASASASMLRLPSRESAKSEPPPHSQRHDRDALLSPSSVSRPTTSNPSRPSRPPLSTVPSASSAWPALPRPAFLSSPPSLTSLYALQSFTFPAPASRDTPSSPASMKSPPNPPSSSSSFFPSSPAQKELQPTDRPENRPGEWMFPLPDASLIQPRRQRWSVEF